MKYKLEDIACVVPCIECNGVGYFMKSPHYGKVMPEQEKSTCSSCRGRGVKILYASGFATVTDSAFKVT